MNFKTLLPALLIVTVSCNNKNSDPEFKYENIVTNSADTSADKTQITIPENQTQTAPVQNTTVQTTTTPTQPATTNTSSGLNPEHGKPGHRCDIAVGAPLNSKPTTTTTTTTPQQVQTVTTKKTTTAPGMNPPHGEPGHRCDIPVGSPLNQPVKKDTTQNIKTVSPIVNDSTKK